MLEVACSFPSRWEAGRIITFEFVHMDLHAYMEVVLTSFWFSLSGCCLYQWPQHSCSPHGHSWQPPTSTPQSDWPPVAVTASPSLERFFPEWSACVVYVVVGVSWERNGLPGSGSLLSELWPRVLAATFHVLLMEGHAHWEKRLRQASQNCPPLKSNAWALDYLTKSWNVHFCSALTLVTTVVPFQAVLAQSVGQSLACVVIIASLDLC